MMFNEGYRDRVLVCRDCGNDFTFTAGEQEFYASKGLTNSPSRCPNCRAARRGAQPANTTSRAPRGEQYEATCATCGRATTVPFIPREDRPVYCNDCFQTQRASRPRRDESYSGNSYGGGSSSSGNSYGGGSSNSYGGGSSYDGGNNYGGGNSGGRGRERGDRRERHERW